MKSIPDQVHLNRNHILVLLMSATPLMDKNCGAIFIFLFELSTFVQLVYGKHIRKLFLLPRWNLLKNMSLLLSPNYDYSTQTCSYRYRIVFGIMFLLYPLSSAPCFIACWFERNWDTLTKASSLSVLLIMFASHFQINASVLYRICTKEVFTCHLMSLSSLSSYCGKPLISKIKWGVLSVKMNKRATWEGAICPNRKCAKEFQRNDV